MFKTRIGSCAVLLLWSFNVACSSDDDSKPEAAVAAPEAVRGTEFRNVSTLLEPYKRSGTDGLYGVAWVDYDVDGDLDLFVPGGAGSKGAFYENQGNGEFADVTDAVGLGSDTGYGGVAVGDFDNDGFPDIYASPEGNDFFEVGNSPSLFYNNGDGTFTDIIESTNIKATRTSAGVTLGDYNNDGYLDIFLASSAHRREVFPPAYYEDDQLYLSNGDLTFTDVTEKAGVKGGLGSCVATFSDYNDDNWIDLWVGVCNDVDDVATPFHLYRNNQDGTFTDVGDESGLNELLGYWMALTFADVENDGDLDMFSTNYGPIDPNGDPAPHALFVNQGNGKYERAVDDALWLNTFAFGASFGDWDNDGWSDLFVVGDQAWGGFIGAGIGTPGHLYFNDGKGGFEQNNEAAGVDLSEKYTSGLAKGDFDGDGFLDLAVAATSYAVMDPETGETVLSDDGAPVLLRNKGNANHWVTLRLRGTTSNRMAIGAKLSLETPDGTRQLIETHAGESFLSAESPWPTFGLGGYESAVLQVTWPSGLREWFSVSSDRVVDLVEGDGSAKRPAL